MPILSKALLTPKLFQLTFHPFQAFFGYKVQERKNEIMYFPHNAKKRNHYTYIPPIPGLSEKE
jgi:DUF1365 family protein